MLDLPDARNRMVEVHLSRRGIRDREVLDAMREVPREAFVAPGFEEFAYEDGPLPIAEGQTISQPYIVALMIEMAEIGPGDHVLEVGTGSGYAAAVMSRIVERVYTIERHAGLAGTARQRFEELGYDNIEVRTGDGTKGWPDAAPFDAILVAAGGPGAPLALQEQLDVGGRLVIPVGDEPHDQRLLKVTRTGAATYSEEDFGGVRFVPLIGEQGWPESGSRIATARARTRSLPEMIAAAAEPLPDFDDPAFGELFDRFGDRRVVLLGEASHGTSEFYRARAAITRRLIEKHGFTIVAVEADWPDAAAVDRYVRRRPPRADADPPFQRFPTWMWRNTDVAAFVDWMRYHNERIRISSRLAGFYGLDIYNMGGSIAAVLQYLDRVDPQAAKIARERYGCLTPWQNEPSTYGRVALTSGYEKCEEAVLEQCRELLAKQLDYAQQDGVDFLDATQNARLIASAERYYRIMYYGGAQSWNLRDTHMFETLEHLIEARGPNAKAVVWAHNSHIGDARYTEMGVVRDEVNIGQFCRQRFGDEAALIGLSTHSGTVAAASDWDGEMEIKRVRPSHGDSYERLCHDCGVSRFLLDIKRDDDLRKRLSERRLERFIGVIYRPETELRSHYADASLAQQFDAFVWFDETAAVTPLGPEHVGTGVPDTYPFGL
ncbi:protein-L-isoaspartate(D-aspartate) O-methyltransferase [Mesorhizobium robiniae]|uniref:Protein-L-isoaspartate O-methyltransferase n=1 Tax=Mesorhizobium robiniae TaxID=559315 RepID=A0ABV2GG98_9HYPH